MSEPGYVQVHIILHEEIARIWTWHGNRAKTTDISLVDLDKITKSRNFVLESAEFSNKDYRVALWGHIRPFKMRNDGLIGLNLGHLISGELMSHGMPYGKAASIAFDKILPRLNDPTVGWVTTDTGKTFDAD